MTSISSSPFEREQHGKRNEQREQIRLGVSTPRRGRAVFRHARCAAAVISATTTSRPTTCRRWMFDNFPNASGQIAVNGYISVLSRLGLWSQQDNLIRLTSEGTAVVNKAESDSDEARRMVIEIKYRDFLGYDVLFTLLGSGPQTLDGIHEHLKEALAVDWKSKNQTTFRVNWLRSLGYVEKDGREYRLTDNGKATFGKLNDKAGTTVTVPKSPPDDSR